MSASASLEKSTDLQSVLNENVMARAAPQKKAELKTSTALNITANPFFKVVMDPSIAAEDKVAAIASMMTTTLDSKKDRETVQAYEDFREWLSSESIKLSKQVAGLMDVETLAEIQAVITELGGGLIDFKSDIAVVMKFIDSIHQLNTSGRMMDVLKDIRLEKDELEKIAAEVAGADEEIARREFEIRHLLMKNADLEGEKSLFGFGATKRTALQEIERNKVTIQSAEKGIADQKAKKAELNSRKHTNELTGEDAVHRENLRKLLDFSNEETRNLMSGLRDKSISLLDSAQDRTGALRTRFGAIADQIFLVEEQVTGMQRGYAIMFEGLTGAGVANAALRLTLEAPETEESILQRMSREDKLRAADSHTEILKRAEADTMTVYTDLAKQAVTVETMKQGVTQQIDEARRLNVRGVAAAGNQIATVLTAISSAANNQVSMTARVAMDEISAQTDSIMHREAIRVAMGYDQLNEQLIAIASDAGDLNEIQETATNLASQGLENLAANVEKMRLRAEALREGHQARQALASTMHGSPAQDVVTETPAADQPFSFSQL